jgi:hypothetical protein
MSTPRVATPQTTKLRHGNLVKRAGKIQQAPQQKLESTPFILYIFKKKEKKDKIEPNLVMLFWDEKGEKVGEKRKADQAVVVSSPSQSFTVHSGGAVNELGISSSSSKRRRLMQEEMGASAPSSLLHSKEEEIAGIIPPANEGENSHQSRWQIKSSKIPISFESDTEQIAFAVAFVTKRGVEFIDDLSCVINMQDVKLGACELTQLSNLPGFVDFGRADPLPSKNQIVLQLERKGSAFLEISCHIHISNPQIKKILSILRN